jgi:hypothetical protein
MNSGGWMLDRQSTLLIHRVAARWRSFLLNAEITLPNAVREITTKESDDTHPQMSVTSMQNR